ncbi:hypothetical protein QTG54_005124, partial [Skeletonema marinoi]
IAWHIRWHIRWQIAWHIRRQIAWHIRRHIRRQIAWHIRRQIAWHIRRHNAWHIRGSLTLCTATNGGKKCECSSSKLHIVLVTDEAVAINRMLSRLFNK